MLLFTAKASYKKIRDAFFTKMYKLLFKIFLWKFLLEIVAILLTTAIKKGAKPKSSYQYMYI